MEFFKTRRAAALVLALAVAFGTLYGSHRSLSKARSQVEATFYDDADSYGHSIQGDMDTCLEVTANLLTVAGRYLNESDLAQLEGARNQLGDWHGLNNGYSAYCTLQEKAAAVLDTLDGRSDVTDQDAKYLSGFRSQLNSAAATISRSSYNDLAEEFNEKTLSVFPASVLGTLTGVEALPIYR